MGRPGAVVAFELGVFSHTSIASSETAAPSANAAKTSAPLRHARAHSNRQIRLTMSSDYAGSRRHRSRPIAAAAP